MPSVNIIYYSSPNAERWMRTDFVLNRLLNSTLAALLCDRNGSGNAALPIWKIFLVTADDAADSILRYGASGLAHRILSNATSPVGTLAVNLVGCCLIGAGPPNPECPDAPS